MKIEMDIEEWVITALIIIGVVGCLCLGYGCQQHEQTLRKTNPVAVEKK